MLSADTHGGQICLPGGVRCIPPACPRRHRAVGLWPASCDDRYTATASGTSLVDVRLTVQTEVTLARC